MTGVTMTRRSTPTTKVAGAGLRTVGKAAREQAGGSTGEPTGRRTVAEIIPPHGGRLMAPWKPGQSGNPSGVISTGAYHEARAICAQASPRAARIQVELLDDADPRIRLLASEAVLNRGVGKPRDHSDEDKNTRVSLTGLSPDELTNLAQLLKRALGIA